MIDLYYWTTPNGHKVTIFLEETDLPYRIIPIDISSGQQFDPSFLAIAPNNRIPAIVDHEPIGGGDSLSLFESGAILHYLAEKSGRLMPRSPRGRHTVVQWLMWQVSGLGPMLGQNHHFSAYAPEPIPYAIDRYVKETARLYSVLNQQLDGRDYITGTYSIADIAAYPWIVLHERQRQDLNEFLNVKHWFERLGERPAVRRAYDKGKSINTRPTVTERAKAILFGQDGLTLGRGYANKSHSESRAGNNKRLKIRVRPAPDDIEDVDRS